MNIAKHRLHKREKGEFQNSCEEMSLERNFDNRVCLKVLKKGTGIHFLVYQKLGKNSKKNNKLNECTNNESNYDVDTAMPMKVEKLAKLFKMHGYTLDFDHSFCKAMYMEA